MFYKKPLLLFCLLSLATLGGAALPVSAAPGYPYVAPLSLGIDKVITYRTYTVREGDTVWDIAVHFGLPMSELIRENRLLKPDIIEPGRRLIIPVHHIFVKPTPGPRYGELLDWWTEAQYLWPIGKSARVIDFHTGISWMMKRTIGANHADVEPLTTQDTLTMKSVWGNRWSWKIRPVIVEVDGRRIAASASAMPHDIQYVHDNGVQGHFDIHFLHSTRHADGLLNRRHQKRSW